MTRLVAAKGFPAFCRLGLAATTPDWLLRRYFAHPTVLPANAAPPLRGLLGKQGLPGRAGSWLPEDPAISSPHWFLIGTEPVTQSPLGALCREMLCVPRFRG